MITVHLQGTKLGCIAPVLIDRQDRELFPSFMVESLSEMQQEDAGLLHSNRWQQGMDLAPLHIHDGSCTMIESVVQIIGGSLINSFKITLMVSLQEHPYSSNLVVRTFMGCTMSMKAFLKMIENL